MNPELLTTTYLYQKNSFLNRLLDIDSVPAARTSANVTLDKIYLSLVGQVKYHNLK